MTPEDWNTQALSQFRGSKKRDKKLRILAQGVIIPPSHKGILIICYRKTLKSNMTLGLMGSHPPNTGVNQLQVDLGRSV